MESSRWASPSAQLAAAPPPDPLPRADDIVVNEQAYADSIDEFAQTRGADDLFDDDFTPIAQPAGESLPPDPEPTPMQTRPPVAAPIQAHSRGAGHPPRGHGRGGRGRDASQAAQRPFEPDTTNGAEQTNIDASPPPDAPAGPKTEAAPKAPTAVRGDRSATGGLKRERLTDEQLAERMRTMSLKNAALLAAHERSLQDEAAFAAREAAAAEKRKIERRDRQQMMGEREKNRQRKLQALGGREWDAEKREEDYAPEEARRGARRGAHGAVVGARREYGGQEPARLEDEDADGHGGSRRGYGDRGRGRGRGRGGRGGRYSEPLPQQDKTPAEQAPPTALDFPELPTSTTAKESAEARGPTKLEFPHKPKEKAPAPETEEEKRLASDKKAALAKLDAEKHKFGFSPISPSGEKKSWADQVESPT